MLVLRLSIIFQHHFLINIVDAKIKKDLAVGIDIRSRDFDSKKIVKLIKNRKKK